MASIINATTSGGLATSADNTGILQLQTGNLLAAQITAAGGGNLIAGSTNPILAIPGSQNNYIQAYIFNNTNGINASSDWVAYPHNGLDSSGFIDIGINSLSFNQATYNATGANEGYILMSAPAGSSTSGNLVFATDSTGSSNSFEFFGNGFNQGKTNPELRIEGTTGYVTGSVRGNTPGLYQAQQYYRLNAARTGNNATGAQSIFGVGVTLAANTVYEFEISMLFSKTAGTTSHTMALGFGGTATLNNIFYDIFDTQAAAQLSTTAATWAGGSISTAAATVVSGAITSATFFINVLIKGTVSVNAAGTFIPQYTLSAIPGGAYTTNIGSYIKISAISNSGANTSIGAWA
jgi:hypothetical protein